MKTAKILISTFILSLALTTFSPAANAIGATPLRGFLKAAPGEIVEGTIVAQNTSDEQQIVVLTKSDFFVKEDESMQFIPEVTEENIYSMQDWISFPKNEVLTEPKSGAEMKYTITVPENAKSQGYYAAVFVQGKPVTAGEGAVSVGASVAHLVLLEVTGDLKSDLEFKSYQMTSPDEPQEGENLQETAQFKTVVFNSGNTHKAPDGKILIYNNDKTVKEELLINRDKYNAMPNRNKTLAINFDYSKYEPGQYYAELNLKLSDEKTYEAYYPFNIKDDGALEIGEMAEGKVVPDEKPGEEELSGQALIAPEWMPWIIGGGIGLIFVFGLIAYLLKKCRPTQPKTKKNNKK